MTAWIDTQTMQYPLYEGDIRMLHYGSDLTVGGRYAIVEDTEPPYHSIVVTNGKPDKIVHEEAPAFVDGKWVQQWSLIDYPFEMMALVEEERRKNNPNLSGSGSAPDVIG